MSEERGKRGLSPVVVLRQLVKAIGVAMIFAICFLFLLSRFGEVFVYREISNGNYVSAYKYSNILIKIIACTHGRNSERYANAAIQISREFSFRTPYILPSSDKAPVALLGLASSLDDSDQAVKVFIEAARFANITFNPKLARIASTKALARLQNNNAVLYDDVIAERAYAHLMSFSDEMERKSDWYEIAQREFVQSNINICTRDVLKCRFNEIRWLIGACIREASINRRKSLLEKELAAKISRKNICTGLDDGQCQVMINNINPYVFHYISLVLAK